MTLPSFLILDARKAGATSRYLIDRDLSTWLTTDGLP